MVSLESAERPNYYLVVSGHSRLQMERWSRGGEFSRRATFIQHQGLFLPGHTSFELVGQPGIFLTLTRTAALAQRYDASDSFKSSSSFTLEGQNCLHDSNMHTHKSIYMHTKRNNQVLFLSSGREQFCNTIPYDVRVALPGLCKSLCAHMQGPRSPTLPVSAPVRGWAY